MDQVSGQDGWLLAVLFCMVMDRDGVEVHKRSQKRTRLIEIRIDKPHRRVAKLKSKFSLFVGQLNRALNNLAWVERRNVRVKCLVQKHNMMTLASDCTQITQSRVQ